VDVGEVTFVDSTGFGMLLVAQRRARAAGGDLHLTNLQPNVRRVLDVSGLDKVLLAAQPV
jgi:anti-anti-sigma factor